MYVIKMKTLICYFAVLVLTLASIGIIKIHYSSESQQASTVADGPSVDSQVADSAPDTAFFDKSDKKIDVPVLMYHSILKNGKGNEKYIISDTAFEADLKYLANNGYTTIVMQDLIDYVYNGKALPEKPIILTFDDGYFNNYAYAFPLLKKYNSKAVLSIIGYYTDLYTNSPDENPRYSHVTWNDINELIESGCFEIQNHSYNLHTTDKGRNGSKRKRGESLDAYKKMLTEDLSKLQQQCKEKTGYIPTTYTYPFGSVSNDSFDIIKEMGFKASLSCEEGMNHISRDTNCLYMLKRYLRTPKKSAQNILK